MEGFDAEKAARVWQRVRGSAQGTVEAREESGELLHQSHSLAGLYLGLQRQLTGQAGSGVRELHRQHRELMACLKGMCLLARGTVPGLPPMAAGSGTVRSILESCFHRERRLGDALAGRSADMVLGPVYQLLAQQGAQRAVAVLKILGELKGREN